MEWRFTQGKSALWSHLLAFKEAAEKKIEHVNAEPPQDPKLLSPGEIVDGVTKILKYLELFK